MATCMPRRPNGPRSPRGWRPRNYWLGTMAPSGAPHEVPAGGADPYANCGLPYHLGGEIRARDAFILASPRSQARAWLPPDLRVLRGIAAREERQPAAQPDREQVDEAEDHECRG